MDQYWVCGRVRIVGFISVLLLAASVLTGCGGGGGGGAETPAPPDGHSASPKITASIATYQALSVPAPLIAQNGNTLVVVGVVDADAGSPISTAAVAANGTALIYLPELKVYRGWLVASTGDVVTISVTSNGATYQASGDLVPSHPQILSPPPVDYFPSNGLPTAELLTTRETLVTWSGDLPDARYRYAVAVLDERGELAWPSRASFQFVDGGSDKSLIIPAGSIPRVFPYISTGIARTYGFAGAAPGSTLTLGGFSMSNVYAISSQTSTLSSIELRPTPVTLARGRSSQMAARGVRVDGGGIPSLEDITGQVLWTSDNPAVASVTRGVVTGANTGTATITARQGTVSASTVVTVLEPAPGPATGSATTYQMNAAHTGSLSFGGVSLPSAAAWSINFPGPIWFPLIADGRVFVQTRERVDDFYAVTGLYAHDAATGARLWGPVEVKLPGNGAGYTYDQGRVITAMLSCRMFAHDAASGALLWSADLAAQVENVWSCSATPTAYRGIAYVVGAGVGATVMAVDVSSGRLLWATRANGTDKTSPTVTDEGVYVSFLKHAYKFDPYTGVLRWHYAGPGSGGGNRTTALIDGRLYMRDPSGVDNLTFDAATSAIAGSFESTTIPALTHGRAYMLKQGKLSAVDTVASATLWTATGDGRLVSAPIVVDDVVFVGSTSGSVFGFNTSSGETIWQALVGAPIDGADENNDVPLTGLVAGGGLLLVPAGNVLTAFRLASP